MKPDLGIHLYESTKFIGPHIFYDVLLMNIDRIERELFTSTANLIYIGDEYCGSFDFPMLQMGYIIDKISNKTDENNFLGLMFSKEQFQYTFLQALSLQAIECQIGELYVNENESYRPLIVTKIS